MGWQTCGADQFARLTIPPSIHRHLLSFMRRPLLAPKLSMRSECPELKWRIYMEKTVYQDDYIWKKLHTEKRY